MRYYITPIVQVRLTRVSVAEAENSLSLISCICTPFPLGTFSGVFHLLVVCHRNTHKLCFNFPNVRQDPFPSHLLSPGSPSQAALGTSVLHESDNLIHPM